MLRNISVLALMLMALGSTLSYADDDARYRPFMLASNTAGDIQSKLATTKEALTGQGFEIVGEYAPYPGAHLVIVTNDSLKQHAAETEFGGFGAAQRIALTEHDGKVQVAYTNPAWMNLIYRMGGNLDSVKQGLEQALGGENEFGSKGGRTAKNLGKYHYMMFMPYFDDRIELNEFDSHQAAIDRVEAGLGAGKGGTSKVYRVDIPGVEAVLFGVAIKEGEGADQTVMSVTDTGDVKHTPHLPYELLVVGKGAYALHGKFRIAQSFPDLTMGTFMKISDAPDGIADALQAVASK